MEGNVTPEALCIFEDDRFANFFPLSLNKPVFELMIGAQTFRERILSDICPSAVVLICRPYLKAVLVEEIERDELDIPCYYNEIPDSVVIFVNGRLITYQDELRVLISSLEDDCVIEKNGVPVVARLTREKAAAFAEFILSPLIDENLSRFFSKFKEMSESSDPHKESIEREIIESREKLLGKWAGSNGVTLAQTGAKLVSYYWQLIAENGNYLLDDFQKHPLRGAAPDAELFRGVNLINEDDIVIGADVEVRSGTVLDASEGPIMIDEGVLIEPNSIIDGPCFIGRGTIIRGGAKIGKGTSIGRHCRIGGEVGESVISSFTNKQHEGFIGHSYIGSWVNLGAGSCNSDLKNNYSKIRAWNAGLMKETGRRFLGLVTGDHVKIAINTRINTGSVIGFCSNVLAVGFPPKFIPSFIWQVEPEFTEYDLQKAVKTAEIMMDRRNVHFSAAMAELFKVINRYCRTGGQNV